MKFIEVSQEELENLLETHKSEISGYEFNNLDFTDLEIKSALFLECKFLGCNFANASFLNVAIRDSIFERCNLMGVNWTETRKNGTYLFTDCKLDYSSFQGMDLRGSSFVDCSVREVDFAGANLSKALFSGANLSGANFSNTNLEKADLRQARSYFIDPRNAKIKEAMFSVPEALVLIEAFGASVSF